MNLLHGKLRSQWICPVKFTESLKGKLNSMNLRYEVLSRSYYIIAFFHNEFYLFNIFYPKKLPNPQKCISSINTLSVKFSLSKFILNLNVVSKLFLTLNPVYQTKFLLIRFLYSLMKFCSMLILSCWVWIEIELRFH